MQCRAGLLDLLGELCLPVLQQIEMLLQQADRLFAGKHVIFRSQHIENAADLGNRHAEPAQRQDVLETAHIAGEIGPEPAMAGR